MRVILQRICILTAAALLLFTVITAGLAVYFSNEIPNYFETAGDTLELANMPFIIATSADDSKAVSIDSQDSRSYNRQLSLLGIIPLKTVRVEEKPRRTVSVLGSPFGIKMFADGIMVVGFSDISSSTGYQNPARMAGLKLGDVISVIGNTKMIENEDVAKAVAASEGRPVEVVFSRKGVNQSCIITAARDKASGVYKSGMWVRDSSAGIGTMTFADNKKGVFAGLGHPVNDSDTGQAVQLLTGEIAPVEITGAQVGRSGIAGELRGRFLDSPSFGEILKNTETGVYGTLFSAKYGRDLDVATPSEIVTGTASILTTINESSPRMYRIEIERIFLATDNFTKNMLIRVVDTELLTATGGIVQGMSGSPIIQNNRFVGAVTHVLVSDPTKGYGIFAEHMLRNIDEITMGLAA